MRKRGPPWYMVSCFDWLFYNTTPFEIRMYFLWASVFIRDGMSGKFGKYLAKADIQLPIVYWLQPLLIPLFKNANISVFFHLYLHLYLLLTQKCYNEIRCWCDSRHDGGRNYVLCYSKPCLKTKTYIKANDESFTLILHCPTVAPLSLPSHVARISSCRQPTDIKLRTCWIYTLCETIRNYKDQNTGIEHSNVTAMYIYLHFVTFSIAGRKYPCEMIAMARNM